MEVKIAVLQMIALIFLSEQKSQIRPQKKLFNSQLAQSPHFTKTLAQCYESKPKRLPIEGLSSSIS